MLAKRIIPCLDCDLNVPNGRVVKGIEFKQIRYAGEPVELATRYYEDGADEIVFLDITASHERRETMAEVIKATTENVFVPICVTLPCPISFKAESDINSNSCLSVKDARKRWHHSTEMDRNLVTLESIGTDRAFIRCYQLEPEPTW